MLMLEAKSPSRAELADVLEQYIDTAADPRAALEVLAEICYGKADHLRTNWQDAGRAKTWERWANALDRAGSRLDNPYK